MEARWDMVAIKPDDDVAVALRDLPPGAARVRAGDTIGSLELREAIQIGHKAARHGLMRGTPIRKYGAVIGEATADIAAGEHVHVHNLRSLRARRKEPTP
jgi:altronate dehydratase small subunit